MVQAGHLAFRQCLDSLEGHGDILCFGIGVGYLHYILLGVLVITGGGIHAVLSLDGILTFGHLQYVRACIQAVHLLHPIGGSAHGAQVVHPDLVGTPLPAINMGKQRSGRSHPYDVGIALQTRHEGSFAKSCFKSILTSWYVDGGVLVAALDMTGIFSGKHLRAFAIIVVIASCLREEPVLITVEVLVHEVGLQPSHFFPTVSELLAVLVVG